ncbi:MAG: arginine--tRNA ligase, partial [SAR202 cluster bacterium]|nr:arginine--tRNA ligase [SAR202 cluster bacterium]
SSLANILEATGFDVQREYYLNDAGNQMDLFNLSLFARYKQYRGHDFPVPEGGYHGEYMVKLAEELGETFGSDLEDLDEDDQLDRLGQAGLEHIVKTLRNDLTEIRVNYDQWFSEKSLYENGQYATAMDILGEGHHITHREGAIWFISSILGDDKDKVLVRSTGAPTYFASDVAYHYNKLVERGFDCVINIWGADHQGHAPFMKAMVSALGIPQERLEILIYQLVTLKREGQTVRLSKRAGDLITLHDLVTEVGPDACRYFFLTRSPDSQMDFDLDLAKKETPENPVFYIQYAHARTSSILRLAKEHGLDYRDGQETLLVHEAEQNLIRKILLLPELMELMAVGRQPHHLPHYAHDLAASVHSFYEKCRVISNVPEDLQKTKARLKLVEATLVVLSKCLGLMSMSAPDQM